MQVDQLIVKIIVPLAFFAIWGIAALFNRESKGFVPRPPGQGTASGARPGDPTLRWTPAGGVQIQASRKPPLRDDDILIIPNDPARATRTPQGRPTQTGPRRAVKTRQVPTPIRKPDPASSTPRLGGVSQNVNQQLARPVDMTPLTTITPMATTTGSELANAATAPSKTSTIPTVSTLAPLLNNPARLREAFIVNEIFQKPLALRPPRRFHV